jgi:hypothetical protein
MVAERRRRLRRRNRRSRDGARERRQDLLAVEITALGGSRPDGIWSRPDITTVEIERSSTCEAVCRSVRG